MTYAVVAAFGLIIVFSAVEAVVLRHVRLVARQRRMCAVRREPRPYQWGSKA